MTNRSGDKRDVLITWITASVIFGILSVFAFIYQGGQQTAPIFLSGVFGASLGWFLGIIATPYNVVEKN